MVAKLSTAAVVLGVVLLVGSAIWGSLFPATRTWTAEKSEELAELGSETNRLKFAMIEAQQNPSMHRGKNPAEIKQQYEEARARYDELHREFETAKESPKTASAILRWSGIAFIAGGGLAVFATRNG